MCASSFYFIFYNAFPLKIIFVSQIVKYSGSRSEEQWAKN